MEELYQIIKLRLASKLALLEDKPEETIESTIKALWQKARGNALSAEKSAQLTLPKLSDQQIGLLHQLVEKRIKGDPLTHITGRQSFMGIELISDKRALIPRKETEILGRAALSYCKKLAPEKQVINIFDICCGSGNLGLAIASHNQNTIVYSSDLSYEAVELTNENISFTGLNNRVKVIQSDLFANFESTDYWGKIDLIVCNPPLYFHF